MHAPATITLYFTLSLLLWPSNSNAAALPATLPGDGLEKTPTINVSSKASQVPNPASQTELPRALWRGDGRSPDQIRAKGGIIEGEVNPPKHFSLWHHSTQWGMSGDPWDTPYVATSSSIGPTTTYLEGYQEDHNDSNKGFIYKIHATPNCFSLKQTHLQHTRFPDEEEFPCLGGVHWDQIEGWIAMASNFTQSVKDAGIGMGQLTWDNISSRFVQNEEYNAKKYDALSASGGQPQLAGWEDKESPLPTNFGNLGEHTWDYKKELPWSKFQNKTTYEYAVEFMIQHGREVGFNGTFPLKLTARPRPFTQTMRKELLPYKRPQQA